MKLLIKPGFYLFLFSFFLISAHDNNCFSKEEHIRPEKKVQGATVIRVDGVKGITPKVLKVTPGYTVIWFNESESLVEIQFTGKQITLACDNPVNFVLDMDGSFVSNKIPMGSVASLCLIQPGEFDYTVKRVSRHVAGKDMNERFSGRLIVE